MQDDKLLIVNYSLIFVRTINEVTNRWRFRNKNSRSENCSPKRGKIDWLSMV